MNSTREQVFNLYTSAESYSRLKIVQQLCSRLHLDAIVAIGGIDGRDNLGSTRLINYLLGGMYGHFLSDNILFKEQMDDLFLVITADHITIYVNPLNHKYIQPKVEKWDRLSLKKIEASLYHNDKDGAEIFKIESFISSLQTIRNDSNRFPKIGFPLTPTPNSTQGSKFEVEQFPLIQTYALEVFKTGSFFTQAFDVESVFHELNDVYCEVDSQSFKALSTLNNSMLLNQWLMSLQNFDMYLNAQTECYNLHQLQNHSEEYFGEPLLTYYKYAHIRSSDHQKALPIPNLSFGGRDPFGCTSSTLSEYPGTKHFTLVASDPHAPICVARTYFLQTGSLLTDACLDGLLEIDDRSDTEEVRVLMDIYNTLVRCVSGAMSRGLSKQSDLEDFVSDFFTFYHMDDKAGSLLQSGVIASKLIPLDMTPYVLNKVRHLTCSVLFYFEVQIKDIELSSGRGSIIYGNTVAKTCSGMLNLTKAYSDFECWFATENESTLTKLIHNNIVNRLTNMHDVMGRRTQDMPNAKLLFGSSVFRPQHGKLRLFQKGMAFCHARMGYFIYDFHTLSRIIVFRDDRDHPKYVLFEFEENKPPYQVLRYCNDHNSFVLALYPGTMSYSDFIQETLPEWERYCDDEGPVLEFRYLDKTPLPDVFELEEKHFALEASSLKAREKSNTRSSLFVPETISSSRIFELDEDWRNVLTDLTIQKIK